MTVRVLILLVGLCGGLLAGERRFPNAVIDLPDGKVITNFTVTDETEDAIFVKYAGGIAKLFKADLPEYLKREYPTTLARSIALFKERSADLVNQIHAPSRGTREIKKITTPDFWERWELQINTENSFLFTAVTTIRGEEHVYAVSLTADVFVELIPLLVKFEDWAKTCEGQSAEVMKPLGYIGAERLDFHHLKSGSFIAFRNQPLDESAVHALMALTLCSADLIAEYRSDLAAKSELAAQLK